MRAIRVSFEGQDAGASKHPTCRLGFEIAVHFRRPLLPANGMRDGRDGSICPNHQKSLVFTLRARPRSGGSIAPDAGRPVERARSERIARHHLRREVLQVVD